MPSCSGQWARRATRRPQRSERARSRPQPVGAGLRSAYARRAAARMAPAPPSTVACTPRRTCRRRRGRATARRTPARPPPRPPRWRAPRRRTSSRASRRARRRRARRATHRTSAYAPWSTQVALDLHLERARVRAAARRLPPACCRSPAVHTPRVNVARGCVGGGRVVEPIGHHVHTRVDKAAADPLASRLQTPLVVHQSTATAHVAAPATMATTSASRPDLLASASNSARVAECVPGARYSTCRRSDATSHQRSTVRVTLRFPSDQRQPFRAVRPVRLCLLFRVRMQCAQRHERAEVAAGRVIDCVLARAMGFGAARRPAAASAPIINLRAPAPWTPHSLIVPSCPLPLLRCQTSASVRRPPRRQSLARSGRGVEHAAAAVERSARREAYFGESVLLRPPAERANRTLVPVEHVRKAGGRRARTLTAVSSSARRDAASFYSASFHCRARAALGVLCRRPRLRSRTCSAGQARRRVSSPVAVRLAPVSSRSSARALSTDDSGSGVGAGGGDGDGEGEGMPRRTQRNARRRPPAVAAVASAFASATATATLFAACLFYVRSLAPSATARCSARRTLRLLTRGWRVARAVDGLSRWLRDAPVRAAPCRATELHFIVMLEVRQCATFSSR